MCRIVDKKTPNINGMTGSQQGLREDTLLIHLVGRILSNTTVVSSLLKIHIF